MLHGKNIIKCPANITRSVGEDPSLWCSKNDCHDAPLPDYQNLATITFIQSWAAMTGLHESLELQSGISILKLMSTLKQPIEETSSEGESAQSQLHPLSTIFVYFTHPLLKHSTVSPFSLHSPLCLPSRLRLRWLHRIGCRHFPASPILSRLVV